MNYHSAGRPEIPCSKRPSKPISVRMLREYIVTFGKEKMMVTLVPVEGGYSFHTHPSYGYKESRVIHSEKSREVRVFHDIRTALNLARSFGFTEVAVEL